MTLSVRRIAAAATAAVALAVGIFAGTQQPWEGEAPLCHDGHICAIFVEPKDFPMDAWYGPNARARAEEAWCGFIVPEVQHYYAQQTGNRLDFDCLYHVSTLDSYALASDHLGQVWALDGHAGGAIPGGQGLDLNRVLLDVLGGEMGVWDESHQEPQRALVMVPNGGGWAGGGSGSVPNMTEPPPLSFDYGYAVMGDWKLTYYLRGVPDPVCLGIAVLGSCTDSVLHAPIHELCHGLGLWNCHSSPDPCCPSVGYGVTLHPEDVRQMPIFNAAFAHPVDPAVPTSTETPPPPALTPPALPSDTPTMTPTETPKPPKPTPTKCYPPRARRCR